MTRPLTRTPVIAAALAALITLTAILAGATPAQAQSTTIDSGHFDVAAEIDCDLETIELVAENHVTEVTFDLGTIDFAVDADNADEQTSNDSGRFTSGPLRTLSELDSEIPEDKLVIGFEVGEDNCTQVPAVTFAIDGANSTVPFGGRAAVYTNTSGTSTLLDTQTGSGLNTGLTITGHQDQRWGFQVAGAYTLAVTATVDFGSGNVSDDGDVVVNVS